MADHKSSINMYLEKNRPVDQVDRSRSRGGGGKEILPFTLNFTTIL